MSKELVAAIHVDDLDGVDLLLNNGANPNYVDPETGFQPLEIASRKNGVNLAGIANLLIRHGANPEVTNAGALSIKPVYL